MLKLLNQKSSAEKNATFIAAPEKLSMGELYTEASRFGEVTIGGSFSSRSECTLHLNFTDGDFIKIYAKKYLTVEENLIDLIRRANDLKQFYENRSQS